MAKDTIYALSTVSGKSGVAVFRISGEEALKAIKYMSLIDIEKINSRHAYFSLIHDIKGETIDHGIIIYFKSPSSFTGEDIVEIHTHGSKAVISSVLENLSRIENFRLAEPGEFSKRAFYNGKMDLTEAEGLADLIDAQTSEQQKYALKQMDGGLKNLYESWREKLIDIMAYLEAYIDFPDEELPTDLIKKIENTVLNVRNEINQHLQQSRLGERLHEGFRVVIIGEPNAGKSSLFNALARKEAVIVSDIAGTTRDAIDIYMDINGYPIIFTDTAGLRDTEEEIEQKGIEIAYEKANKADLIICLLDGEKVNLLPFLNLEKTSKNKMIYVINKKDKISVEQCFKWEDKGYITISAKYQEGIEEILKEINKRISENFTDSSGILITRHRYREILNSVFKSLENFNLHKSIELSAEDIRIAAREIGKITGRIEVNEILDKIFGSFCIGK